MNRILLRTVLTLFMLTPLLSYGFFTYTAEPIEAWVVDAETNQPLQDVIVVAHWQLKGGLEGGNRVGQMMVMETVTDAQGRFYFPGWGPKFRPLNGELKTGSPELLLFKSGYEYSGLENELNSKTMRGNLDSPLRSDWNGKTVKLERFKGEEKEYTEHIYWLSNAMYGIHDFASGAKTCTWKSTPLMLMALHKISYDFEKKNVHLHGGRIHRIEDIPLYPKCGSPEEYFKEFLP